MDAPYLRIVADVRRRIEAGELTPGDRVSSTRQLAADWGVALATATRAMTELSRLGLVEARSRVGTVVAKPKPAARRARSEPELTRDRVVRAGVEIADAEGLEGLSMRAVAVRLGVATMSPYRYVDGKDDLVLLMADAAYGEENYPIPAPEHWRARVEVGAWALWRTYRRHPWLAQIGSLTRPLVLPNLIAHGEWILSALEEFDVPPTALFDLHVLIYSFGQGLAVNLEREAQAAASTGLTEDDWIDEQSAGMDAMVSSGRYPAFARMMGRLSDGYELDLDHLFELGLRFLLDGFALTGPDRPA